MPLAPAVPPKHSKTPLIAAIGIVAYLFLMLLPLGIIANGLVLAKLWEWFVADTFNVHALSLIEAMGISVIVTFLTYDSTLVREAVDRSKDLTEILGAATGKTFSRPAWAFLIGLLLVQFR